MGSSPEVEEVVRTLRPIVRGFAFWAAVFIPMLLIGLVATEPGLQGDRGMWFVVLLALNVVALVVGHRHKR